MCLLICIILRGDWRGRGERCDGSLTGWFAARCVFVSNWRCPNRPSLAGKGKEEGRARVKMALETINCRNKYKTPPSLLLLLPIVFYTQSFSILVVIGRHNGITFLHCFEGGSSSGDQNASRVRRGGRGGWGELPRGWLWFLGSGLLNYAKAAQRW